MQDKVVIASVPLSGIPPTFHSYLGQVLEKEEGFAIESGFPKELIDWYT